MLTLNNVHTYYDESHILQGVSMTVGKGEAIALMGRNGVGKTTTINSIMGFAPAREGQISLRDTEITDLASHRIAQMGVGLVPQGRGIFPTLSVRENITLAARDEEKGGWTFDRVLDTFPALKERLSNLGSQLSGGEQQMLSMARALMTNPELLLLDEPSEGLAPLIVVEIGRIVSSLRAEGLSILLVEQNISLALKNTDRVYVMSKGRIVHESQSSELLEQKDVMHKYLGV